MTLHMNETIAECSSA